MILNESGSFFRSEDVSVVVAHSASLDYRKAIERTVRARTTILEKAEILWNFDDSEVLKSVLRQIQISPHETAATLTCIALVACLVRFVCSKLRAK